MTIVGVLSWNDIKPLLHKKNKHAVSVGSIMKKHVVTVNEDCSVKHAQELMESHNISFLPVIKHKKLIGLITNNDL